MLLAQLQRWRAYRYILLLAGIALPALALAQTPASIERLVSAANLEGMRRPDFREYQPSVREFYEAGAFAPAWTQEGTPTAQALTLIQAFEDSWKKGLEPEDYDASRWNERRLALQRPGADIAGFDVAMTVSTMRYVSDLRVGRINPQHVKFGLSVEQKKYDLAEFLRTQVLPARDVGEALAGVEPPFAGYQRAEQALIRYVELGRRDESARLPVPVKPIEPGHPYSGLQRLASFLRLVGDLTSETDSQTSQLYDGAVVEAVKRFQRRHGLDEDGRLGPTTVKELNVPLADRVRQLQLTLERWRWLPSEFSSPPIVVNIPDFRLRALDAGNTVEMDMRVVVGKAMRTQTPVFSRDMSYVVFRPYWVVPPGIMRRQILPAIQRDRDYLAKNRYEVTTHDGSVITSGTVSDEVLSRLQAGKLTVRQRPGPNNALGLVKLMFPNEHHVYLHSTPATELFARTRRDFSSGCIRVEKPAELTAWVLRNNSGWSLERVQQGMQSGRDNVTVSLARRIPVLIIYGTAIAYPNDEVHFYDDLYGHDARLAEALARRNETP